jgi:hypothetical protein
MPEPVQAPPVVVAHEALKARPQGSIRSVDQS